MAGGGGCGCDGIHGGGRGGPDGIHFRCPATATCGEAGGSRVPLREDCVLASGGTVDPVRVLFVLLHLSCARVYFPSSTGFWGCSVCSVCSSVSISKGTNIAILVKICPNIFEDSIGIVEIYI
jgi:hypothetical protein